ncbi:SDR family NAD(P)-dependent oxidoreductase [Lachnospiraceae bacterium OF09-33XD]|nr:SDR family NAD(P)-dependent oxidoreductase [Lachnospiraceae bacterium OF09-33XD]
MNGSGIIGRGFNLEKWIGGQMMKFDFSGKTVAITGGGSGIGKLSCQRFAEAGARVAVIDINSTTAQQTADEITKAGLAAHAFQADITDEQAVETTFQAIADCFGSIDILFNQAGISPWATWRPLPMKISRKFLPLIHLLYFSPVNTRFPI